MLSAVNRPVATRPTALCAIETMTSACVRMRGAYERQKQPMLATQTTQAIALTRGVHRPTMVSILHPMDTRPRLPHIYFEKLLESSPDIVVAVDRKGFVIFYNDGAPSTLGYSPEEMLGQHVSRLYPDLEEARKVMAAMRDGLGADGPELVRNFETSFVAKSGAQIP